MTKVRVRVLPEYLEFSLKIDYWPSRNSSEWFYTPSITKNGRYIFKLTDSQWRKASKYLTRVLIPFSGYSYSVKPEYQVPEYQNKEIAIK
jgi:hypothetical protein